MDYIVKYVKRPYQNYYTVICSDGSGYSFKIGDTHFLYFFDESNDILFTKYNISKSDLYRKVFNRNYENRGGIWPYCKNNKECITLLKALIKETQVRYYADTEL